MRLCGLYRPESVSPRPPSGPLSLRLCLSRSLSASLASFSVWRVLAVWAASSPAWPFLCCARPSAFFSSSPVTAPAASFILPLALSSMAHYSFPTAREGGRRYLSAYRPVVVYLQPTLHRLQHLVGAVEGVGARVPYPVDHLLGRVVALGGGDDLLLVGWEVYVRQVLLELAQVEVAQVAQIAKTHAVDLPYRVLRHRRTSYP